MGRRGPLRIRFFHLITESAACGWTVRRNRAHGTRNRREGVSAAECGKKKIKIGGQRPAFARSVRLRVSRQAEACPYAFPGRSLGTSKKLNIVHLFILKRVLYPAGSDQKNVNIE
ncbi:hypothetical protein [Desulfonema magnum]|uniref:Uncharacterized protein n=1 Tax=Desulfonema magnum TaxID=45655 RepID=A0A975BGH3_9BACT|nr:hypothetical protein [Desulfonema magnum]QTA84991.1 Uncharacterized protein dnm_009950 [Desulfonema magnum]